MADIHEQFTGMVEELHPDTRPEVARFLLLHPLVSEEALIDAQVLFAKDFRRVDADMAGMEAPSWYEYE